MKRTNIVFPASTVGLDIAEWGSVGAVLPELSYFLFFYFILFIIIIIFFFALFLFLFWLKRQSITCLSTSSVS